MRIATWNVNSLKARLEKVMWWLDRAKPDVLLMQETKLADADAPVETFKQAGYELVHHGEGRWNGVAIASRCGIGGVITNFGEPYGGRGHLKSVTMNRWLRRGCSLPNAAACASSVCTRRTAGSWARRFMKPSSCGSTGWLAGSTRPSLRIHRPSSAVISMWRPKISMCGTPSACHGGTHVSERERQAFARLSSAGFVDAYRLHHPEPGRYTWWDYRAGNFYKNFGMRIDHLLVTTALKHRVVWAEIDREARKGKPLPSDHAPLVIDIDSPGHSVRCRLGFSGFANCGAPTEALAIRNPR